MHMRMYAYQRNHEQQAMLLKLGMYARLPRAVVDGVMGAVAGRMRAVVCMCMLVCAVVQVTSRPCC